MVFQDVIQQITAPPARRKRDLEDDENLNTSIMGFLSNGGMDALKEGVPEIMLDLLVGVNRGSFCCRI